MTQSAIDTGYRSSPRRTPEIIAHRGASREYPENTLSAFARALELGVDGIELDVHGTHDGVVVVHHDKYLHALEPAGTLQLRRQISDVTHEELNSLALADGVTIPTLHEVLNLVEQGNAAGTKVTVYVEVKGSNIEQLVADVLSEHPMIDTPVHSFDHRIPVNVRSMSPGLSIGLLSASYPLDVRSILVPAAAEAWWQDADLIDEQLVRDVHAAGARLIAWTVNDVDRALQLAHWGVDGLCTDAPAQLADALRP